nr:hypothetical protein [Mucilaginibacter sp. L294]
MLKPKRKRILVPKKINIVPLNDGTNTPVPGPETPPRSAEGEAALFKQAENPLGDPHKL